MNVLIAYAGKTGATKKCVDYMKMISIENVTLYDAKAGGDINYEDYDVIIMGGSIRIGVMDNSIRKFAKERDFTGKINISELISPILRQIRKRVSAASLRSLRSKALRNWS
jgi:menaquinone-dependent protoporphyrinogen IX oxidase